MWNPNLAASETVTWSGECSGGLAQGTGLRQWSHPDDEGNPLVGGGEGELRDGKPHGPWSEYHSNGGMAEGSYDHGEPVGPWTNVVADGTVFEGEWANGQRRGRWTLTYGDDVGGGFYVAGKRHGRWRFLIAANDDETLRGTREGTYLAGNRNGPAPTAGACIGRSVSCICCQVSARETRNSAICRDVRPSVAQTCSGRGSGASACPCAPFVVGVPSPLRSGGTLSARRGLQRL